MAYSIEDIEKMMGKSSNKAAVEKARQGEWHGFGVNDPDEGDWSEFGEKSPALLAPTNSINAQLSQQQLGRSGNTAFKEYVARVQQAIDKAPEAQPQWLQNKKTQTPIFSTAQNAPANLVDLIKMQYDNPPNRTGFAAGSVAGASAPPNDELIAFRTELSNSPDIAMRYRWANASDEDVAAELQRRKQAELQNQEYQRLMEENAKNMTLDDYIDPSYRLNDFDKTRAQEIIDAFYEKYPKDGKWYNGDYSPNTRKAMYNDPDMQKIVILENKLNPAASLVYGAKNALPIDPFGKTYENAVEKLYDAVGADQSAYDTLHNTMEGTRSAASNAQTQNPVAYLGGYMGTNIGLYKGGKDIMLGLPGIGKGLKAAGGAISNAASKVPAVGSTLGRVLTADRVAGFLGDSALDLALDTIPNEVVTGLEEGESAAQIAKDAAGNMAQNALFNVAGEVVPATIKGTSNLITRGQMNRIADALDDGAKLTAEQISEYNRLAAKVGEIGSEDWLNVNMAKYADEMPMKNAAQPIATGTEASIPSMADLFPLSNKTPVQSETDALVDAFYNNTLTNAQIETLKPGGKNRAAFEAATGLTLPETSSKTRALLKLGAEESIDGTLKTEYNGVSGGAQNGTDFGTGIGGAESGRAGSSNLRVQSWGQPAGNQRVFRQPVSDGTAYSRAGATTQELVDSTADPEYFSAQLNRAIKENKNGLMVSPKTPQELADSGAITFMSKDGMSGAAVTADGDIEAVFRIPGGDGKRLSYQMVITAVDNGGVKLDCYGEALVKNYSKMGFEPVAKVKWNPEYAPDGWNYGPKDVYVMKLQDGLDAAQIEAKLGLSETEGGFHMFTDEELAALPEMDYDETLAYRDSLLEQGAKPVDERIDGAASAISTKVQANTGTRAQKAPEIPSGMKERGFAESLRTKSDLPTEVKQEFIDNPELYKSLSNETTVARAEEIFARGETEARNAFSDMLKTADPAAVPLGKMIADDLIAKGDRAGAVNVLRDMSAALTRSGQFSQAAVIALTKADPMTALQYIQRQVDTMNAAGAKKFGRKWNDFELTDAEIDAFKNIDPGDTQAVETAMENVGKRISKEYPATVYEKLLELRRIGMLLNPRTMVRNTLANAAMMPVQGASGKVSALIQDITHRINPDFTPTQALHVSKESKTLASQVADNMRSVLSGDTKYYEFQGQGAGAKGQNALNDLNQYARDKTIFKGEIKSDWLSQLVDKTAYELNKVSQKTAQQDLFSGMTSEKGILENTRQLTYGLLELGDAGFVDKFFRDRLASYIEARGIKSVNDVPPEAITTALDEAMKATFKDDNALTEMLSSIKRSTNRVGGMGNFLLTFTKTPANIAMRIADYSPAGLISAAAKHVKGQTDAAQFIDDISKGLTGTGLMVLGAQLFKAGILTGPESDDKDEAAFMRTQGFKPNAVHVGDKYYTVDWAQPAASGLMMGAAIMAELEKNPDASFADASVAAGKTALNTWIEASPVKSIEDLFSSYEGLPGGVAELVQEIPGSFIPSTVGATARTVDPVQRQTYSKGDWLGTLFGGMQAKIPGASKSLPAAYDTWGRPITRQNSTGEAAFAQFVSPGTLGNANESPIDNVILELFQDTGNNKVFPRKAGWSVTVDGESKSLTNREYSDYQREMGQMSYNIAEYLVPKFDNLTDEQKVSVLDNAYSMAKDVAENELFGADLSRTTEKRMEEASALDGNQYANWAEILFAHAIIKDVTGDKVPGTDRTISGSAKKNKIAALVDAGYSQYQAMQLYDLLNG
ncbi:hypothetical protein [Ruthenibacterium lactatiformans]|uniref:hypothetical protein n=1 Tax=Ruthenibacterium lactatiformans TaxID=1550024 RepID=UPI00266C37CD|nr:hypothetical protein [Ruthenibacterium lactatiformans]